MSHSTDLLVEVLPVVLGHESEQREERPAEGVEAGVAVVWITTRLHTYKTLWTEPGRTHGRYQPVNTTMSTFIPVLHVCKSAPRRNATIYI